MAGINWPEPSFEENITRAYEVEINNQFKEIIKMMRGVDAIQNSNIAGDTPGSSGFVDFTLEKIDRLGEFILQIDESNLVDRTRLGETSIKSRLIRIFQQRIKIIVDYLICAIDSALDSIASSASSAPNDVYNDSNNHKFNNIGQKFRILYKKYNLANTPVRLQSNSNPRINLKPNLPIETMNEINEFDPTKDALLLTIKERSNKEREQREREKASSSGGGGGGGGGGGASDAKKYLKYKAKYLQLKNQLN